MTAPGPGHRDEAARRRRARGGPSARTRTPRSAWSSPATWIRACRLDDLGAGGRVWGARSIVTGRLGLARLRAPPRGRRRGARPPLPDPRRDVGRPRARPGRGPARARDGGHPAAEEFPEGVVVPVDPGALARRTSSWRSCDRLLGDAGLRERIAALARAHVREHHDLGAHGRRAWRASWARWSPQAREILAALAADRRRGGQPPGLPDGGGALGRPRPRPAGAPLGPGASARAACSEAARERARALGRDPAFNEAAPPARDPEARGRSTSRPRGTSLRDRWWSTTARRDGTAGGRGGLGGPVRHRAARRGEPRQGPRGAAGHARGHGRAAAHDRRRSLDAHRRARRASRRGSDEGYDVAIGSRALPGLERRGAPVAFRESMGRVFNLLVRAPRCSGAPRHPVRLQALHRGGRAGGLRARAARRLLLRRGGLFIARQRGLRIAEVPVTWRNDAATRVGLTKGARAFLDLVRIRWLRRPRGATTADPILPRERRGGSRRPPAAP